MNPTNVIVSRPLIDLATASVIGEHTAKLNAFDLVDGGRTVVSGGADRLVRVFDLATGAASLVLEGHGAWIHAVAASPDGTRVATAGRDRHVRMWNGEPDGGLVSLGVHRRPINALAWFPDARSLAVACADGTVHRQDADTGETVLLGSHVTEATDVAVSPDGRYVASVSYDNDVLLCDLESSEIHKLAGHERRSMAVRFSPDGRRLATGGYDHKLLLFDITERALVCEANAGAQNISTLAFSPCGEKIVTGGAEGTISLYAAETLTCLESMVDVADAWITAIRFTPDGEHLVHARAADTWGPCTRLTFVSRVRRASDSAASPAESEGPAAFWELVVRYIDPIERTLQFELAAYKVGEVETGEFYEWLMRRRIFEKFDPKKASLRRFMQGVIKTYAREVAGAGHRKKREMPLSDEVMALPEVAPAFDPANEEARRARIIFQKAVHTVIASSPRNAYLLLRSVGVEPFPKADGASLQRETGISEAVCHQAFTRARKALREALIRTSGGDDIDVERLMTAIADRGFSSAIALVVDDEADPDGTWVAGALDEAFRRLMADDPLNAYLLARTDGLGPFEPASLENIQEELPRFEGEDGLDDLELRCDEARAELERYVSTAFDRIASESVPDERRERPQLRATVRRLWRG